MTFVETEDTIRIVDQLSQQQEIRLSCINIRQL